MNTSITYDQLDAFRLQHAQQQLHQHQQQRYAAAARQATAAASTVLQIQQQMQRVRDEHTCLKQKIQNGEPGWNQRVAVLEQEYALLKAKLDSGKY